MITEIIQINTNKGNRIREYTLIRAPNKHKQGQPY